MPVYRLDRTIAFPPPEHAEDGLLAVGGDLRPERLLLAYASGIFPWYSAGQPILWHSPDPRMVLRVDELHVPARLARTLRKRHLRFTLDEAFAGVIQACANAPRPGQEDTWITAEMQEAYIALHELGFAHSVEAWETGQLVGGLYGVSLGAAFFGESMFSTVPDASKAAFVVLVGQLRQWGITLVDAQMHTPHLARFGATEWSREEYLGALRQCLRRPTLQGRWRLEPAGHVLQDGTPAEK